MAAMNVASKNGFYPLKTPSLQIDFLPRFSYLVPPSVRRQNRLGGASQQGGVQNGPPLALADVAARNYYNIWRLAEL